MVLCYGQDIYPKVKKLVTTPVLRQHKAYKKEHKQLGCQMGDLEPVLWHLVPKLRQSLTGGLAISSHVCVDRSGCFEGDVRRFLAKLWRFPSHQSSVFLCLDLTRG